MIFSKQACESLQTCYPLTPAKLSHMLCDAPEFSIEYIAALAGRLPPAQIEYNAGDLPVEVDPSLTPSNGLSVEETIRRIKNCKSWMVLKNVEQDAKFNALLKECLGEIAGIVEPATGAMSKMQAYVFVTSPGSTTPFHMDPEHNILLQIAGSKTFTIYPADAADIVSDEQHEAFHGDAGHRNLQFDDRFDEQSDAIILTPGDALYVPVKAPHWVLNGDDISISFSVTWRSRFSDNDARLRQVNGGLRARGAAPQSPGKSPAFDAAKVLAHRAINKLRPPRK